MITFDIRRWDVRHLIGASALYWTGLAAATLTPFARAVASVVRLGAGHGSASGSMQNDVLTISAIRDNVVIYSGSAHALDVALWLALPPLALWLVCLALRPQRGVAPAPSYEALPDAARNGYAATPTRTGAAAERRENRG